MTKTFFKYRPIVSPEQLGFVLDIITNQKVYLSPVSHFADPFDPFMKRSAELSSFKALSLSTNGDNRLLWAYYACWYCGVMIKLRFNLDNEPFRQLKQVIYTNSESLLHEGIRDKNYFLKHAEFRHEKEWRAVYKTEDVYYHFPLTAIENVTIGPALSPQFIQPIVAACSDLNVPVFNYELLNGIPIMHRKTLFK